MGVTSLEASVKELDNFSQLVYNANSSVATMDIPKPTRNPQQQQPPQQPPPPWPPLRCPRCNSTNTKFCYYNNYSKLQPRYLCKACRRHWTDGGTLRDVPVGGGRKNKRTKTAETNQNTTAAASMSSLSGTTNNTSNSVVQQFLNGGPSTSIFPDILRQVLLHSPQQIFPQQLPQQPQTVPPDVRMMSSLVRPREVTGNYLGSYTSGLNNTFSISGYTEPGTGGNTGILPHMQLGTGNWSSWDDDISGLANLDVKPPTTSEGC